MRFIRSKADYHISNPAKKKAEDARDREALGVNAFQPDEEPDGCLLFGHEPANRRRPKLFARLAFSLLPLALVVRWIAVLSDSRSPISVMIPPDMSPLRSIGSRTARVRRGTRSLIRPRRATLHELARRCGRKCQRDENVVSTFDVYRVLPRELGESHRNVSRFFSVGGVTAMCTTNRRLRSGHQPGDHRNTTNGCWILRKIMLERIVGPLAISLV